VSDFDIIGLAVSLSLDASAVSLALSAAGHLDNVRAKFRIAFHFGLFQFLMPLAGWALGTRLEPYIAAFDHWVAFGLLVLVAVRMILSARETSPAYITGDPTRGWSLMTLATATSVDALAIGLGLAAFRISVWYPSVIIGLITLAMSVIAIRLGARAGQWLGTRGQIAGGIVLILIALKIVASHTL
jgi:putative Mn2+ efflux pump MntP